MTTKIRDLNLERSRQLQSAKVQISTVEISILKILNDFGMLMVSCLSF